MNISELKIIREAIIHDQCPMSEIDRVFEELNARLTGVVLDREQLHKLRSSLGTMSMACNTVRALVPSDVRVFFDMIDTHLNTCLEVLKDGDECMEQTH